MNKNLNTLFFSFWPQIKKIKMETIKKHTKEISIVVGIAAAAAG